MENLFKAALSVAISSNNSGNYSAAPATAANSANAIQPNVLENQNFKCSICNHVVIGSLEHLHKHVRENHLHYFLSNSNNDIVNIPNIIANNGTKIAVNNNNNNQNFATTSNPNTNMIMNSGSTPTAIINNNTGSTSIANNLNNKNDVIIENLTKNEHLLASLIESGGIRSSSPAASSLTMTMTSSSPMTSPSTCPSSASSSSLLSQIESVQHYFQQHQQQQRLKQQQQQHQGHHVQGHSGHVTMANSINQQSQPSSLMTSPSSDHPIAQQPQLQAQPLQQLQHQDSSSSSNSSLLDYNLTVAQLALAQQLVLARVAAASQFYSNFPSLGAQTGHLSGQTGHVGAQTGQAAQPGSTPSTPSFYLNHHQSASLLAAAAAAAASNPILAPNPVLPTNKAISGGHAIIAAGSGAQNYLLTSPPPSQSLQQTVIGGHHNFREPTPGGHSNPHHYHQVTSQQQHKALHHNQQHSNPQPPSHHPHQQPVLRRHSIIPTLPTVPVGAQVGGAMGAEGGPLKNVGSAHCDSSLLLASQSNSILVGGAAISAGTSGGVAPVPSASLSAEDIEQRIARLISENEAILEPSPVLAKRRSYTRQLPHSQSQQQMQLHQQSSSAHGQNLNNSNNSSSSNDSSPTMSHPPPPSHQQAAMTSSMTSSTGRSHHQQQHGHHGNQHNQHHPMVNGREYRSNSLYDSFSPNLHNFVNNQQQQMSKQQQHSNPTRDALNFLAQVESATLESTSKLFVCKFCHLAVRHADDLRRHEEKCASRDNASLSTGGAAAALLDPVANVVAAVAAAAAGVGVPQQSGCKIPLKKRILAAAELDAAATQHSTNSLNSQSKSAVGVAAVLNPGQLLTNQNASASNPASPTLLLQQPMVVQNVGGHVSSVKKMAAAAVAAGAGALQSPQIQLVAPQAAVAAQSLLMAAQLPYIQQLIAAQAQQQHQGQTQIQIQAQQQPPSTVTFQPYCLTTNVGGAAVGDSARVGRKPPLTMFTYCTYNRARLPCSFVYSDSKHSQYAQWLQIPVCPQEAKRNVVMMGACTLRVRYSFLRYAIAKSHDSQMRLTHSSYWKLRQLLLANVVTTAANVASANAIANVAAAAANPANSGATANSQDVSVSAIATTANANNNNKRQSDSKSPVAKRRGGYGGSYEERLNALALAGSGTNFMHANCDDDYDTNVADSHANFFAAKMTMKMESKASCDRLYNECSSLPSLSQTNCESSKVIFVLPSPVADDDQSSAPTISPFGHQSTADVKGLKGQGQGQSSNDGQQGQHCDGGGRGKFACDRCGVRCEKLSLLKKHFKSHLSIRTFKCNGCSFSFKTKGNLTKHMKTSCRNYKAKFCSGQDGSRDHTQGGHPDSQNLRMDEESDETLSDDALEIVTDEEIVDDANSVKTTNRLKDNSTELIEKPVILRPTVWQRIRNGLYLNRKCRTPYEGVLDENPNRLNGHVTARCPSAPLTIDFNHFTEKYANFSNMTSSTIGQPPFLHNKTFHDNGREKSVHYSQNADNDKIPSDKNDNDDNPDKTNASSNLDFESVLVIATTPEPMDDEQNDSDHVTTRNDVIAAGFDQSQAVTESTHLGAVPVLPLGGAESAKKRCEICQKEFTKLALYELHCDGHRLEKSRRYYYKCPYCNSSSRSKNLLRKHLEMAHSQQARQQPSTGDSAMLSPRIHNSANSDRATNSLLLANKNANAMNFVVAGGGVAAAANLLQSPNGNNTSSVGGATANAANSLASSANCGGSHSGALTECSTSCGDVICSGATCSDPRPFKCQYCKVAFRIHGHLAKHLRSKSHIMNLEHMGEVDGGTFAMLEEAKSDKYSQIDTSDCRNSLESLRRIRAEMLAEKHGANCTGTTILGQISPKNGLVFGSPRKDHKLCVSSSSANSGAANLIASPASATTIAVAVPACSTSASSSSSSSLLCSEQFCANSPPLLIMNHNNNSHVTLEQQQPIRKQQPVNNNNTNLVALDHVINNNSGCHSNANNNQSKTVVADLWIPPKEAPFCNNTTSSNNNNGNLLHIAAVRGMPPIDLHNITQPLGLFTSKDTGKSLDL